jgi:hypothetical protein
MAALVAALSGTPAAADYNYPNTQEQDPNAVQKALIIMKKINNMKNYGSAGLEGEVRQEINNILRGDRNQSRVLPIIDKIIKSPSTDIDPQLPPLQEPEQPVNESEARLDPEVEEFLEGLTPDDVGYDLVGDYVVHYEGFTDQCQDSEEYQDDPESVFNDVWGDFKRRMGDKDPINYGIVGEHDYPIVYSVFRR